MTMLALRDLRNHVSEILRRVEAGESFSISVRGRPVARLVPLHEPRRFVSRADLQWLREREPDAELNTLLHEMDTEGDDETTRLERLYEQPQ